MSRPAERGQRCCPSEAELGGDALVVSGGASLAMTDSIRIDLGAVDALPALPAEIRIKSRLFFLARGDAGYRLIASTCPHQGGTVQDRGTHFECPLHNWRFDRSTGRCINAPSRTLASFAVHEAGGRLYADIPIEPHVERVRRVGGAKL